MSKLIKYLVLCWVSISLGYPPSSAQASDVQSASTSATIQSTASSPTDVLAPSAPILVKPTDGTVTSNQKPEFIWYQSTDPNGNTVTYTLYQNDVAIYLGISGSGNSTGLGYTSHLDGNQVILHPTQALPEGEYNWYVKASDNSANSSISTTWHFTIDTTPPNISLLTVDTYQDLNLSSLYPEAFTDLNFDIAGPKEVYLTVKTDPWSTLTTKFTTEEGTVLTTVLSSINSSGLTYPSYFLPIGTYLVSLSSYDRAGNTTALPDFQLTLTQAKITIPLPDVPGLPDLPESYTLTYVPISLPSFPATVSKIETSLSLPILYIVLLAIGILLLLFLALYKKYNIILLNDQGQYHSNIKIYHSIPTERSTYSSIFVTRLAPITYFITPRDRGRIFIKHLSRYSTLTIKTAKRTYILSLSAKRKLYTLVLT